MYEMKNEIPFTRAGADGKLKLHEAVGMMMDCSQFQEYQEKALCEYLRSNGLAIFLFSIQIDILRMPSFRERVTTAVKIYGCKSIYGLRRFTIKDEAGNICLIANATGAFFDINAGKAAKIADGALPLTFDEPEPMECLPRKIPVPNTEGIPEKTLTVTPSLLDPNGHLTSAVYFSLAGDSLPPDYTFDRVRIEYKKQARPGEIVYPVRFDCGNGTMVVDMRGEDGKSCAVAEFSNRERA